MTLEKLDFHHRSNNIFLLLLSQRLLLLLTKYHPSQPLFIIFAAPAWLCSQHAVMDQGPALMTCGKTAAYWLFVQMMFVLDPQISTAFVQKAHIKYNECLVSVQKLKYNGKN